MGEHTRRRMRDLNDRFARFALYAEHDQARHLTSNGAHDFMDYYVLCRVGQSSLCMYDLYRGEGIRVSAT